MPMREGDQFVDFKALKAAMQDWAMTGAHKFNFRYKVGFFTQCCCLCS